MILSVYSSHCMAPLGKCLMVFAQIKLFIFEVNTILTHTDSCNFFCLILKETHLYECCRKESSKYFQVLERDCVYVIPLRGTCLRRKDVYLLSILILYKLIRINGSWWVSISWLEKASWFSPCFVKLLSVFQTLISPALDLSNKK